FAQKINATMNPVLESNKMIKAGQLNAMGLIDEIFHYICGEFRKSENPKAFTELYESLQAKLGEEALHQLLVDFNTEFPPVAVYQGKISIEEYLKGSTDGIDNKVSTVEEMMLLCLANENPAFLPFKILFDDEKLQKNKHYYKAWAEIQRFFKGQPLFGPFKNDLITMLREPSVFSPHSLKGQLDYIRQHWSELLGEWILRLLSGMDMISEEEKPGWSGHFSGPPPMDPYNFSSDSLMKEYERFSPDREWMPRVVLMAKTVLVWLDQLRKKYKRDIYRLDQIPDEELDALAQAGFTGLWLIGLWERSWASKRIKQICGNPEAAASAYSLHDYDIAGELGGWPALEDLRRRCWYRGIRLASDMVPNHTGMDSKWVAERPDLFIQTRDCPFPGYTFNGENLSIDNRISVYLEDHYYSKNDCAVVYKRVDNATGDTRYIYHGNDGTGMPWNDTAQIDFLNPEAREEVIQKILHVARNFPIIRFDAAMVLAKKHIKRLWYPEPGQGGDIASRAEHAMFTKDFEERIPNEFWREVVDRCAAEVPDTLLLAEAFWMMEGYFVRTLGMHRVYNSAFMNMLKREENQKYRDTVKNTIEFEPQILKRYVNFMNNPDEETAVAQFGRGDKYFG
ncbi:MAG: alpha-amylase, partial [Spirochaetaceae bacterium]|nr:alpha-amylase [Spirochaetaceae bacterium]